MKMKDKMHKICGDCEHYAACASWNIGSISSMDATHCVNFKKVATSYWDTIEVTRCVPLEPLCQWLAGYAAPPNYALDEVRDDSIDPESLVYTANDRAKAWEYHFRELLKSGLMDTEESNAENK